MKKWSIEFLPEAEKDLAKLDGEIQRRIIDKINWLLENISCAGKRETKLRKSISCQI